ncbi:MAG TPA: hypothetical protein VEU96_10235 [Bryobacteraceae bacterium]|nr:hypothetical protein [Bryobacteraceae bacterium]
MAKSLELAAIGLRAHSGWAALVAVAGSLDAPHVIARRRIETADASIHGSKQPFHKAEPMELADAKAYIKRCTDSTRRLSRDALEAAIDGLRDKRYEAGRCGIILGSGRKLPELAGILASHALIHTAEGEFFRQALVEASEHCGLALFGAKERELLDRAAAQFRIPRDRLDRRLIEIGKPLGPPWTQDQKYAALAGWMSLSAASGSPD